MLLSPGGSAGACTPVHKVQMRVRARPRNHQKEGTDGKHESEHGRYEDMHVHSEGQKPRQKMTEVDTRRVVRETQNVRTDLSEGFCE